MQIEFAHTPPLLPSFYHLSLFILLLAVLAAGGWLLVQRRRLRRERSVEKTAPTVSSQPDDRTRRRSLALDAVAEAVLIVDREGRVRDCNSHALSLFCRHRAALEGQFVNALRRFEGVEEADVCRVAAERGVWNGEAWARQPDGGVRLCEARVVALRDGSAMPDGYVEAFLEVTASGEQGREVHDIIYGVRAFDSASGPPDEVLRAIREDLRVLSEAFRDLDLLLRQYERILPSLSAEDPLTESIAGLASETRALAAAVGAPALLEEIPRALGRLRENLRALQERARGPGAAS